MKSTPITIVAIFALAISSWSQAQNEPASPDQAATGKAPAQAGGLVETEVEITTPQAKQARDDFNKLPAEKRESFLKLMSEGQQFLAQRRVTEALEKFNQAEGIYPRNPNLLNLKGAALVNIRDFERASKYFGQAAELYPKFWQTHFNLAEMHFVRKDWETAEKGFRALLDAEQKVEGPTRRLVDYKVILCLIKKGKADEAKKMIANYDIYDDSPIFYYATAALHFERDERKEAEEWVTNARGVYSPQINSIFEDSLTELGWLFVF
jgi:tetratricopeptide (TPR) repeat protein